MSETQETLSAAPELVRVAQLVWVCRGFFALQEVYGYSGKEIATRLGIPDEAAEELFIQGCAGACADKTPPAFQPRRTAFPSEEIQVAIR